MDYPYWFLIGIYDDNKILFNNNMSISECYATRSNKNLEILYLNFTLYLYDNDDKKILNIIKRDIKLFFQSYINIKTNVKEYVIFISYILDFLVNNNEINYHESIETIFNDNKSLSDNEQLMFYLISKNNDMLYFASERLKNDKNFLIPFIKKNGYILKHVHENLKNDEDVVRLAIKNDLRVGVYANQELLKRIVELQPIKKNI